MQKYTKIFLIFSLLTFTLLFLRFFIELGDIKKLQNMVVKDESKSLSALFLAFRTTYQDIFLKHHIEINDKTINLLPVRTTTDISNTFSNIVGDRATIRTVSDRPRNELNRANSIELGIIDYFKKNPNKKSFFKAEEDAVFYYAQPLHITKNCLQCHGKKADAVKTVRENYDTAYDYKEGELRGILSIKVSKKEIVKKIHNGFFRDILTAIIIYILFLTAIYLMIRIIVKNEKIYAKTLENKVAFQIKRLREQDNALMQQSKMAEMGEMIGNIAHQWRQPLSMISTGASGVKLKSEFNDLENKFLHETMDSIVKNSEYLSQTIDDFRNFIKGDRNKQEFTISSNIDSTLKIMHGTLTHYDIHIIKNIDTELKIISFPNELTQIIINILSNSKDAFNEQKTLEKYIFISAKRKDENIILSIKDNANGIPVKIIDKVFDPYFTTKHQSQGTGLGLYMVHKLITESLKGKIKVSNKEYKHNDIYQKGSEFKILLPISI